jgi:8-oxo-dGTP pyrophosphatase MutT (NUDIX family)
VLQRILGRGQTERLPLADADGEPLTVEAHGVGVLFRPVHGVLTVPRWLAHGLGLRHPVVHLVLETHDGNGIWLQRRALTRPESPGRLDISVGGHMGPSDTPETALDRETREELGLDLGEDCAEIQRISAYESISRTEPSGSIDVEWRHVFVARVKPGRAWCFRLDSGELAGVAPWPYEHIAALLETAPHQCASGLAESVRLYLNAPGKSN